MSTLRQVPLYKFCSTLKQWQAVTPSTSASNRASTIQATTETPIRFTCITYNVFSGPLSKSIPHASHRTKHAIDVLARSECDIIALQEVSPAFEQALRRESWLRRDWYITSLRDYFETASKSGTAESENDGCIMAIKTNLYNDAAWANMLPLPGQQGKVLIVVRGAGDIHFATSHFESLASSERTRLHQYDSMMAVLKDVSKSIVLADFNHSSYGELKALVGPAKPPASATGLFVDCAVTIRNGSTSQNPSSATDSIDLLRDNATFGELYPFFEGSRRKEKRKPRRLDVILARGDNLKLVKLWTDGHKAIQIDKRDRPRKEDNGAAKSEQRSHKVKLRCQQGKGGHLYPSDHLAVLATFEAT